MEILSWECKGIQISENFLVYKWKLSTVTAIRYNSCDMINQSYKKVKYTE